MSLRDNAQAPLPRGSLPDAILSIERALQERDAPTGTHSKRVSRYAVAIAVELGVTEPERREIRLGAELHDVGKIGVPDELLRKPGRLTAQELACVQAHPVVGERILRPLLGARPAVMAIVRWHHERVDGRGYPDGLAGEQIPLAARIVAVADAFDAMTSERTYRSALGAQEAKEELRRVCGAQLDTDCVRALLRALRRRPELGELAGGAIEDVGIRAIAVLLAASVRVPLRSYRWRGRSSPVRPAERAPPWRRPPGPAAWYKSSRVVQGSPACGSPGDRAQVKLRHRIT